MYTPDQQVVVLSWMPTASKREEEERSVADSKQSIFGSAVETFVGMASGKVSELEDAPAAL